MAASTTELDATCDACYVERTLDPFAPCSPTGKGENGRLGRNSKTLSDSLVPAAVTVPAGVSGWTVMSAGGSHSCAVAAVSGGLYCWGEASVGGCLGLSVACVFRCLWGVNHLRHAPPPGQGRYGQLGRNSVIDSLVPVAVTVPAGVSGWTAVSAGGYHSCAIATGSGGLYCWGEPGVGGRLGCAVVAMLVR